MSDLNEFETDAFASVKSGGAVPWSEYSWVRHLLIWSEETGLVRDADPAPVRWPAELPASNLRLDVRGAPTLPASQFWQPIAAMEGGVGEKAVNRAVASLAEWDEREIGQWAETAGQLCVRVWKSLRQRSDYLEDIAGGDFMVLGSVLAQGQEATESVIRDPSVWSPKWVHRSDAASSVVWLAEDALRRRRQGRAEVFVYSSFTDLTWHIRVLANAVRMRRRMATGYANDEDDLGFAEVLESLTLERGTDNAVEEIVGELLAGDESTEALLSRMDQSMTRALGNDAPRTPPRATSPYVVTAKVDFEGFAKTRAVLAELPDGSEARRIEAQRAVESYGGRVIEISSIEPTRSIPGEGT